MTTQPAVSITVAAAILALALAEGGFPPEVVGVATAGVWALLAGLLAGGRIGWGGLTPTLLASAGVLAALAALMALSTGWASDAAAAFVGINRTLLYLGAVLLVGLAARRGSGPSWLAGIALGGLAVAVVALAARLFGFGADIELATQLPLAAERISYPIGYWNGLGYMMAMTVTALVWFAGAGRPGQSSLATGATVPVVVVLFLTSSRGSMLMMLVGVACVAWLMPVRIRLIAAAIAAIPAWFVAVVATAARRGALEPPGDPGLWGVALALAIVACAVLAGLALNRLAGRGISPARARRLGIAAIAVGGVALLASIGAFGVDSFVGSFRGERAGTEQGTAAGLASGSDRLSFWGTAMEGFAEDPVHGIGAGGFPNYWNRHGDLSVAVQNAHSAPVEEFAELGLAGGTLMLAALGVPLWAARRRLRRAGPATRALTGPVLGILLIGAFAVAIDWTWELPAAIAPFLICVGLVSGRALAARGTPFGSEVVDPAMGGYEWVESPSRPPPAALGLATAGLAAVAIGCGAILALASIQMGISADRLGEGDLVGAADAARAAAAIEPWSAEPSLRLAEIEQAGTNYESARRRAEEAIRASPDDFRGWVLLSQINEELDNPLAAVNYGKRATILAPLVLERAADTAVP